MSSRSPRKQFLSASPAPRQPSCTYSRSGLSRSITQTNINFDLRAPKCYPDQNHLGSEPAIPDWLYAHKYEPLPTPEVMPPLQPQDLQRYLPLSHTLPHYCFNDPVLVQRYTMLPPMARRISILHEEQGPDNEQRRNARQIARNIYQRSTPPAEHMIYMSQEREHWVEKEMNLLDELCIFRPEYLVVNPGHGIPTACHNEKQIYYDLLNLLNNRRHSFPKEIRDKAP